MDTHTEDAVKDPVVAPTPAPAVALAPESVVADVPTAAMVPQKENSDGTVTITATALEEMMSRLAKLEAESALVLQVQDKNKIMKIEELRRAGKLIKSVKIRKVEGKYVLGWKTVQDEVYKDGDGRLVEKQVIKLFFDNGTETDINLRQWVTVGEYVPFDVKGEERDEEGNLFFRVVSPDGKDIKINAAFVN